LQYLALKISNENKILNETFVELHKFLEKIRESIKVFKINLILSRDGNTMKNLTQVFKKISSF